MKSRPTFEMKKEASLIQCPHTSLLTLCGTEGAKMHRPYMMWCPSCKGKGGKDSCKKCHGKGYVIGRK
jgi:hypothetical protein